eukprot:g16398.t1
MALKARADQVETAPSPFLSRIAEVTPGRWMPYADQCLCCLQRARLQAAASRQAANPDNTCSNLSTGEVALRASSTLQAANAARIYIANFISPNRRQHTVPARIVPSAAKICKLPIVLALG